MKFYCCHSPVSCIWCILLILKRKCPEFLQFHDWNFLAVDMVEGHSDSQGDCRKYNVHSLIQSQCNRKKNVDCVIPSLHFILTQITFYRWDGNSSIARVFCACATWGLAQFTLKPTRTIPVLHNYLSPSTTDQTLYKPAKQAKPIHRLTQIHLPTEAGNQYTYKTKKKHWYHHG